MTGSLLTCFFHFMISILWKNIYLCDVELLKLQN